MSDESFDLTKIQEIRTTDDLGQANQGLARGWVLLKISEDITGWEDGSKTSRLTYHLGKPKTLPI